MVEDRKTDADEFTWFSVGDQVRQPVAISHSVGYVVRRIQMRVYEGFFAAVGDLDITPTRYTLMLLIRENPGIRSVDLAGKLGVARSRMVKLINDLECRNLISRQILHNDRRNRALVLTPLGERKLQRLEQVVERHEAELTEGLSEEERESLLGLLRRIA